MGSLYNLVGQVLGAQHWKQGLARYGGQSLLKVAPGRTHGGGGDVGHNWNSG